MTPPTYADVLQRLVSARRFGVVLGLDRMRTLLDALGAPDKRLGKIVHVAGTNGKGSTVAMITALARQAPLRVAQYTSPHLNTLRERMQIDGTMITPAEFVAYAERVSAAGGDELTFFEQVTAIAMCWIADAKVDLTVLEVGLGGRLDATNVVRADVAVITGVAMDHEAILGTTLEAIAREKAGIIKAGQAVIIGAAGEPAAVPMLVEHARAAYTTPVIVDEKMIARVPPVSLVGSHQRANAAAAIAALDAVAARYGRAEQHVYKGQVTDTDIATALANVHHPGRFEILRDQWIYPATAIDIPLGDVIVDGAHNPHGCAALARTLRDRNLRPTLILAVSSDKDARAMLRALLPAVGDVVVTRYGQERAMDMTELARIVREVDAELVGEDRFPDRDVRMNYPHSWAFYDATRVKHPADILVAGSLFLVGEVRHELLGVPNDPILATDPPAR